MPPGGNLHAWPCCGQLLSTVQCLQSQFYSSWTVSCSYQFLDFGLFSTPGLFCNPWTVFCSMDFFQSLDCFLVPGHFSNPWTVSGPWKFSSLCTQLLESFFPGPFSTIVQLSFSLLVNFGSLFRPALRCPVLASSLVPFPPFSVL
jgi:hypothetical protein